MEDRVSITVGVNVNAPMDKVWECWTEPRHITNWYFASEDWHAPRAEKDLRAGGSFVTRMEAKDGSAGFDFGGVYDEVREKAFISYTLGDGRKVETTFQSEGNETKIVQTFDAETTFPLEMQQAGWQAILDNFKKYCEQVARA